MVLKFVASGLNPLRYFRSAWNCFDFVVVVGCYLPGAGAMASILRLLRLLRVLKLVKSLPELQVIVSGLISGLASIGYIAALLLLLFYLFAIIGISLFRQNDPWHFGSLHDAIITLFRCATLEDWTDVMYINMYGCDKYGYDHDNLIGMCTHPVASKALSAIYFVFFVLIAALVMFSLFIGVVCAGIDEASKEMKIFKKLMKEQELSHKELDSYKELFAAVDMDASGFIDKVELNNALKAFSDDASEKVITEIMKRLDSDDSKGVDIVEFITTMATINKKKATKKPKTEGS